MGKAWNQVYTKVIDSTMQKQASVLCCMILCVDLLVPPLHFSCRFGSHPADSQPVQRVVRINNTSPEGTLYSLGSRPSPLFATDMSTCILLVSTYALHIFPHMYMYMYVCAHTEIRVHWQVYNILQEDSDVVDLITTIGPPFPRHTPTHSPAHPVPSTNTSSMDQRPGDGMESGHSGDGVELGCGDSSGGVSGEVECDSQSGLESVPMVRVVLRAHEGVRANKLFTIHPTQMVGILTCTYW